MLPTSSNLEISDRHQLSKNLTNLKSPTSLPRVNYLTIAHVLNLHTACLASTFPLIMKIITTKNFISLYFIIKISKNIFELFLFYKIINFIFCANILFLNDNDIQKQALN